MAEAAYESAGFDLTYTLDPLHVQEGPSVNLESDNISVSGTSNTDEQHCGRKRRRNPEGWKKKHVKKKGFRQNAPLVSVDDLVGKSCCKKACVQKVSAEHITSLRQHLATLSYEEQNLYLTGLMIRKETKKSVGHKRKSNPTLGKNGKKVGRPVAEGQSFSIQYQIRDEKGVNQKVCQKSFQLLHGFGKRRLEILRKKMPLGSVLPEPDQRGKHRNRPQKIPDEIRQKVREHISSFPAEKSHYSRNDNPRRVYLSPSLSITRMYHMFLEKHDPDYVAEMERRRQALLNQQQLECSDIQPIVTEHFYHDIFVNEFNIHFGFPRSDTCDTCDALKLQIQATEDEEKLRHEEELQAHLEMADKAYASLRKDCEMSKTSWSNITNTSVL